MKPKDKTESQLTKRSLWDLTAGKYTGLDHKGKEWTTRDY
jgi:hypothetical protein